MAQTLLMPKATAVWLVDNTALSFDQIAQFCKLHPLEVKAIADGEAAQGIKGLDPIATGQLSRDEIARAEKDVNYKLKISEPKVRVPDSKRRGPRYTPVSKRQDRPDAIAWLLTQHPELGDAQISRLVGTTKPTIGAIRERTHWNMQNLKPQSPVKLGLCTQAELMSDLAKAERAAARRAKREAKASTAAKAAAEPPLSEVVAGEVLVVKAPSSSDEDAITPAPESEPVPEALTAEAPAAGLSEWHAHQPAVVEGEEAQTPVETGESRNEEDERTEESGQG